LLLMREVLPDYRRQLVSTLDVLCCGGHLQHGGKGNVAAASSPSTNRSKASRANA
jgi:hypothetical protein